MKTSIISVLLLCTGFAALDAQTWDLRDFYGPDLPVTEWDYQRSVEGEVWNVTMRVIEPEVHHGVEAFGYENESDVPDQPGVIRVTRVFSSFTNGFLNDHYLESTATDTVSTREQEGPLRQYPIKLVAGESFPIDREFTTVTTYPPAETLENHETQTGTGKVIGLESVTTPAGVFLALRIDQNWVVQVDGQSFNQSQRLWFAEGVGLVRNLSPTDGSGSVMVNELISYKTNDSRLTPEQRVASFFGISDSTAIGAGRNVDSPWFGEFAMASSFDMSEPEGWLLHDQHGWIYWSGTGWFWRHSQQRWVFMTEDVYPFAYVHEWDWFYFDEGSPAWPAPQWYYDYTASDGPLWAIWFHASKAHTFALSEDQVGGGVQLVLLFPNGAEEVVVLWDENEAEIPAFSETGEYQYRVTGDHAARLTLTISNDADPSDVRVDDFLLEFASANEGVFTLRFDSDDDIEGIFMWR